MSYNRKKNRYAQSMDNRETPDLKNLKEKISLISARNKNEFSKNTDIVSISACVDS